MRKHILPLLFLLLAAAVLLTACGKEKEGDKGTYTITFSVKGTETTQTVAAGETPVFAGTVGDYEEGEHFYRFLGWDSALAPATADKTYTAIYETLGAATYTVSWRLDNDYVEGVYHEGETPVPPKVEDIEDEGYIYSFSDWYVDVVPVTKDTTYIAHYTRTPKLFDVTFRADGVELMTIRTAYGTTPSYTGATPTKKGLNFIGWTNLTTVKGDMVCEALFSNYSLATIEAAIKGVSEGNASSRASAAVCIALQERQCPGTVTAELLSYLRYVITGGNEPAFDLTPNFYFPFVAATLSLAKETDSVWSQLTAAEIARLDLIMKSFCAITAIGTDDENKYTTGPGLIGNYDKGWNPNYRLANVTQILFAVSYFGSADAVNRVLADFDYDTYIALFTEYGWKNALGKWTTTVSGLSDPDGDGRGTYTVPYLTEEEEKTGIDGAHTVNYVSPKIMLMEGGTVYSVTMMDRISLYVGKDCGTGLGVPAIGEKGYTYHSHTLEEVSDIWVDLQTYNYGGGRVLSQHKTDPTLAYIIDRTTSPVQGLTGMLLEFNSGNRSSLSYCLHDFTMGVGSAAALEALGLYDSHAAENETITRMIWVGNTDLMYKAEHGYMSYTGTAVRGAPVAVYASNGGQSYVIWSSFWLDTGAKEFDYDDFEFPDESASVVISTTDNYAKDSGSNDLTVGFGTANSAAGSNKSYVDNDFILAFSLLYDDSMSAFGIRLRSSIRTDTGNRADIISVSADGTLTPVSSILVPKGDAPLSFKLEGYGWHRIAIVYHQGILVDDTAKSVSLLPEITILVDGVAVGTYSGTQNEFTSRGWLLFGATYNETAENHYVATAATPKPDGTADSYVEGTSTNNVYWQFYRGGFFNNTDAAWFLTYGDGEVTCGTAPASEVVKVNYVLNGGTFTENGTLDALGGYTTSYTYCNVAYYAVGTRAVSLPTPVLEGKTFLGWYDNADFTGTALDDLDPAVTTYYASFGTVVDTGEN